MLKFSDAVLNAPAARTAAGDVASAGGTGVNATVEGVQGGSSESPLSIFESLAGSTVAEQLAAIEKAEGRGAEPVKARAKSQPTQAAAKPKATAVTTDEADEDEAGADDAAETNTADGKNQERDAILPDDEDEADEVTAEDDSSQDEDSDDADDGEAGSDDDADPEATKDAATKLKALEKDNFKTRAKNRELREQLEKVQSRIRELESQSTTAGMPITGMPEGFEAVKTDADLSTLEQQWQASLEWAEDHEQDGYNGKDAQGNEVDYTPQQIRSYRRQLEKALKRAETARSVLKDRQAKEAEAKAAASKKYPFVLDASSSRHSLVKEIEAEHPEITLSPQRALLLGRLAVAKLIEGGAYELVKKGAKPAASTVTKKVATPPPPPPARRPAAKADGPEPFSSIALSLAQNTLSSLTKAA